MVRLGQDTGYDYERSDRAIALEQSCTMLLSSNLAISAPIVTFRIQISAIVLVIMNDGDTAKTQLKAETLP